MLRENAPSIRQEYLRWNRDKPEDAHLDRFGYADPTGGRGKWHEYYIWPRDPFEQSLNAQQKSVDVATKASDECNPLTPITCRILRKLGIKEEASDGNAA